MTKLICLVILIPLTLFPLFAEAQGVTEEEVRALLDEYTDAYTKMDLDRFMALFSKNAVENRTYLYKDIYKGYEKQFRVSKRLKYKLTISFIKPYARSVYVSGWYIMKQTLKKWGGSKVYRGAIQFDLVHENGSLKIKEINYGMSY